MPPGNYVCSCPVCQRYVNAGRMWPAPPTPKMTWLPSETSDVPILGLRAARLRCPWVRGVDHFGATNLAHGWFGVEARAVCKVMRRKAFGCASDCPRPSCMCGFYAVPPDLQVPYEGDSFVRLEVELAGRVIVHTRGFRAAWQRVLKVRVPPCSRCGGRMTHALDKGLEGIDLACSRCQRYYLGSSAWRLSKRKLMPVEVALEGLTVPWESEGRST